MPSGLDLLRETKPVEEIVPVRTGLDLLKQPVATKAPTTEVPVAPSIHPAAAYLEKFAKPPIEEYDKYQMAPLITAENTAPAMDTLGRLWNLAQHPYDVVKGSVVFASAIPGFIGGLASAVGTVPIEILKGGTVLDWYNASAKNMQTISGLWHRGVSAPLGKLMEMPEKMGEELALTMFGAEPEIRKDETELVGEIFMAPYTAIAVPLHEFADSPTWDNCPNVRGLLKFSSDALGLMTMGLIFKGGPVMAAKKVDPIVKKAHEIGAKEKAIDASGLDEILKVAQKKILDGEKIQLELEIESLKKQLDHEKLAKENLKDKGKEVEVVKEGVEVEAIREERLKFAEEAAKKLPEEKVKTGIKLIKKLPPKPPKKVPPKLPKKIKKPKPKAIFIKTEIVEGKKINIYKVEGGPFDDKIVTESHLKMLKIKKPRPPEPITDLDLQTGTKEPPELSTENSPFRETPERTQAMKEVYVERAEAVRNNPELMTNKLLNDVNRWLDGEELPVEKAKNDLSELAARADELRNIFRNPSDFDHWKRTTSDAAIWARKADRLEIERPEPALSTEKAVSEIIKDDTSNTLYSGFDPTLVGKEVKKVIKSWNANHSDLLKDIIGLMHKSKIDLDVNYSSGKMWADIPEKMKPKTKIDKIPQTEDTIKADISKHIPLPDKSINSIISDPPYLVVHGKHIPKIGERFGYFKTLDELLSYHDGAMKEFARVLKPYGRVTIKVQDISKSTGERTLTMGEFDKARTYDIPITDYVKRFATKHGLRYLGKFVYVNKKNLITDLKSGEQRVPRKAHVEFLTFEKTKRPIKEAKVLDKYGIGVKLYTGVPIDLAYERMKRGLTKLINDIKTGGLEEAAKQNILKGYELFDRDIDKGSKWLVANWKDVWTIAERGNLDKEPLLLASEYIIRNKIEVEGLNLQNRAEQLRARASGKVIDFPGPTLYSGLPLDKAVKQLKEMSKNTAEFMKEFKGSFKEKEFDFAHAVGQVKADTIRSLWDQSETLLNIVKRKYPDEYERIATRQRSAVTGIGYGKVLYGQAVKEIYGGKSKEMIEVVNAYILARRFRDIYGYRTEKGYKHQPGYGSAQTTNTSAMIEMIKDVPNEVWEMVKTEVPEVKALFGKLTPEEMTDIVKAGEAYFEWSRKVVDDLVEVGIKSPEEGALLKSHDFRKFKTMSVKKLYDFNYTLQLKGETIKVSNSGVLELGAGSTKIIEPDSRVVLSEQMARAYGSIAHQTAALEWKGLADKHPDNGFVSMKKQAGWSPIPYVADGVRKNIYFHPDVVKYLVTRSRDISPRLAMVIRNLTLAPVTRSLAVGLSPIWSTLAGLPMDVMHSLWAARTWEADAKGIKLKTTYPFYETKTGKFRKVYSPFAGVDALQIGLDMKRTLGDVYSRGPLTTNLMKHGLVMNFLTQRQNRYMKGVKPPGDWAKMMDLLSYHGLSMELWTRVATADRVIRRDAKKLGITYEQALKNDDIMYRAAHAGRDRMDYNQGGWLVKALDQSGMIFLNAAVLGTRTFWRQAVDNPVDFAFKTAQLGLTAAGITAAAWSLYPETMKDMSDKVNRRDVTWPLFPDWLRVKDRDGDDISFYLKLRMDPNAAFMYRIFEGMTRTYMYDQGLIKEEPDYHELVKSLKQLGPVDVKLPPGIQAWVDYTTNYSWWKDRQMYTQMGGRTFDWPDSQYEGMYDPDVPQTAKDIAGITKASPKRLAGAISNVIPRNNEFVWLMGSAYEEAFSDLPEEVRKQHWLVTLAESPGFNKIVGMTRHGRGRWKVKSDVENEIELERMVRNGKFNMLATQNAWYGVKNQKELFEFMKEQDFDVHKDMIDVFKFIKDPVVKTLPHRNFWLSMKHMSIEGRAKTWIGLLDRSTEVEKKQLMDELSQVMIVGGVVTPEFMEEVGRLRLVK